MLSFFFPSSLFKTFCYGSYDVMYFDVLKKIVVIKGPEMYYNVPIPS